MSSNTRAATPDNNRKRASSPIRKYLNSKPSTSSPTTTTSTPTTTAKKPLSSPDDNIKPPVKKNITPKSTTSKPTELQQSRFLYLYSRKNIKSRSTTTNDKSVASTSASTTITTTANSKSKEFRPPSLKRSHSAISHLDTVNESWMNSPLCSNKKACDNNNAVRKRIYYYINLMNI